MTLYVNDLELPDANVIQPGVSYVVSSAGIPRASYPISSKDGTDSVSVTFEIILTSYGQLEQLQGIFDQNDVVIIKSTWQVIHANQKVVYATPQTINVGEQLPNFIKTTFTATIVGTPSDVQPGFSVSSRQIPNWVNLAGLTVLGLPGTAYSPSTGATSTRALTTLLTTPSWSNDQTYLMEEVRLGELSYEVDLTKADIAVDTGPSGLHGTSSGVVRAHEEIASISVDFAGGYISVPNHSAFGPRPVSAACWFYSDAKDSTERVLVDKGMSYSIRQLNDNRLEACIYISGGANQVYIPASSWSASFWHHIAFTHDGSTLRIYLDGREVSSTVAIGTVDGGSNAFCIGASYSGTNTFDGRIRDVRVFSGTLTADEVKSLHRLEDVRRTLVVHYPLNIYTGSLWRNSVKMYDSRIPGASADRVRSKTHVFLDDCWLVNDLYQVKVGLVTDTAQLVLHDANGTEIETFALTGAARAYVIAATDDYAAIRTDAGHVVELWRGKDPAVTIPGSGTLTYTTAAEAPSQGIAPAAGTNYVALGGDLYVASNRNLFVTGTSRNIVRVNNADTDQKFWLIKAATLGTRHREGLKKLG